ncbi:MAG: hypothetical protein WDW36_006278 [Sanguina aurantia]
MSSSTLQLILEKIVSKDKDFRYMATSDLLNELKKDGFRADADLERKLSNVILNQLEDASGDISNLAVSCLGLLVRKISDPRAEELIRSLCDKVILGKKEQQREIAAIGLKTVIKELHSGPTATATAGSIAAKMMEGIRNSKNDSDVVLHCLDLLTDTILRFGHLVGSSHGKLQELLLPLLDEARQLPRKKALHCLAALSTCLADDSLDLVVDSLLAKLQSKGLKADLARTYMQAVGQISRSVGYRFGKHLAMTVPLMMHYCDKATDGDDELREYCLQAMEGLVLRLPHESRAQLDPILATALKFLRYDPNFEDDDAQDEPMEEEEEAEEDADGSEQEYSDDEDVSWKVRRSAAKVITAVAAAFPEALRTVYRQASAELVSRFREREESVKMDVFAATIALLRQVGAASKHEAMRGEDSSPLTMLQADVPALLKAIAKQLRDKSPKTKIGVLGVLRELVTVIPDSVADHVALLLPGILASLNDKSSSGSSSTLKIEALCFLKLTLATSDTAVYEPHLAVLCSPIFAAVGERYYKVAAEALRVCEALVAVLRPDVAAAVKPRLRPVVAPLFAAVLGRLSAQDQDQEVKECAILCMGAVLGSLGDALGDEVPAVLRVLLERLRNEITRLPAVKAFCLAASTPLAVDFTPILDPVMSELTSFLRKVNRQLRQASLATLEAICLKYGASLSVAVSSAAVEEAAVLVAETDMSLASLALRLFVAMLQQQQPQVAAVIAMKALPPAMVLVRSPLLQGGMLQVLQRFFAAMAAAGIPQASFETLLSQLLDAGRSREAGSKQAQQSVAQCVAVLTCRAPQGPAAVVARLLTWVATPPDAACHRLALLCLGEIGRRSDLQPSPQVASAIAASLSSPVEEVKAAASTALGAVACGNLPHFLPSLLTRIAETQGTPKQQYLLLQSLTEVISTITAAGHETIELREVEQQQVLSLLLGNVEGEEECRNVVAECLGRLALLHPQPVLAALSQRVKAPSANMRSVVVSAIRYAVVDKPHAVDAALAPSILTFLLLMGDADRHVRKAAVVALSAAAHQKASLVVPHLEQLLPLLYGQTAIREDMVRTVDLGPFKHKIDDGLELRKAAFECLDILLDTAASRLNLPTFISHLKSGLRDHYDVKMPCHLMMVKMAGVDPGATLAAMDSLVEPLQTTLTAKLKSDSVKQEIDRHEDMLRSCLRAVDALSHVPGVDAAVAFQSFMSRFVMVSPLKEKFLAIEKERAEAEGGDKMDTS